MSDTPYLVFNYSDLISNHSQIPDFFNIRAWVKQENKQIAYFVITH